MSDERAPQSFDDACLRFSAFLRQNRLPGQIAWVEESDLVWDKHRLWIRIHPGETAWANVRQQYADGLKCGLGVSLHAFAAFPEATIAAVTFPRDEDAAQRNLMQRDGLKLSARVEIFPASPVISSLQWWFLSLRHHNSSRLFWTNLECS